MTTIKKITLLSLLVSLAFVTATNISAMLSEDDPFEAFLELPRQGRDSVRIDYTQYASPDVKRGAQEFLKLLDAQDKEHKRKTAEFREQFARDLKQKRQREHEELLKKSQQEHAERLKKAQQEIDEYLKKAPQKSVIVDEKIKKNEDEDSSNTALIIAGITVSALVVGGIIYYYYYYLPAKEEANELAILFE